MRYAFVFIVAVCGVFPSAAWAEWGCAYNSSAGIGRFWAQPTEADARSVAMKDCTAHKFKDCRIIGCSDNVSSKEDADKVWARTPGINYDPCGGKDQRECGTAPSKR